MSKNKIFKACEDGDEDTVIKFIEYQKYINITNSDNQTPLIIATINNHIKIVKKLCDYEKIKINMIDSDGYSALSYAVINNNPEMVELLLSKGSDYIPDGYEDTPMLHAYTMGYNKIVRILYDYGETVPNNYLGLTRKRIRYDEPNKETKKLKPDELILAIKNNSKEDIIKCLNEGYDINRRYTPNNTTPLIYATELNNLEIVKLLCDKGADYKLSDSSGGDAHLVASIFGYEDLVNYFESLDKKYSQVPSSA